MARPLRLEYPGAVYHVTSRGNARQDIVMDDRDRTRFLEKLAHVIDRFGWRCHAFCLIAMAYRKYRYRLREIAEHLGVHEATVSRCFKQAEQEAV